MKHLKSLLLLFICHGLISCSIFTPVQTLPEFPLFDPADLGQDIQLTQIVTSEVDELPQVMLAAWSIQEGQMNLVGLTITGQEILRLQYDGKKLIEQYSPMLTIPINGRIVISQIQFSYWPFDKIQQTLERTDWKLLQDNQQRTIIYKNYPITTIKEITGTITPDKFSQYWPELMLESPKLEQRLTIKTFVTGKKDEQ